MGEMENKVKGAAKEAAGKAQQAWGEATDQPEDSAEGEARELEGKAQKSLRRAQGATKNLADKAGDAIERTKDDLKR